jgi:phosphoribosyl 1,2-cyclic phosphodiesterase
MKLTFLGTGTSTGVPSIGCECETCLSEDPRDKRLRVSIIIEHAGQSLLVDTSSDFRQQALRFGLKRLDGVLITHCHADHIFGLDDIQANLQIHLRAFTFWRWFAASDCTYSLPRRVVLYWRAIGSHAA